MLFYNKEDILNEVEKRLKKYFDELDLEPECFDDRFQVIVEPRNQRHMSISDVLSVIKEIYIWNRSSYFEFYINDEVKNRTILKIYYKIRKNEWGYAIE